MGNSTALRDEDRLLIAYEMALCVVPKPETDQDRETYVPRLQARAEEIFLAYEESREKLIKKRKKGDDDD